MPAPFDSMTFIEAVSFVSEAVIAALAVGLCLTGLSLWGERKGV